MYFFKKETFPKYFHKMKIISALAQNTKVYFFI